MKIFITGHLGYIGSRMVEFLSHHEIKGYDLVHGQDILDRKLLTQTMSEFNPDVVIHLAAVSNVPECNEKPELAFETNGTGTSNVIHAMKISRCKNIIYASTSAVYGTGSEFILNETIKPSPCSPYGLSKLMGEDEIIKNYDGNYLIYRMFNIVGSSTAKSCDRLFDALKNGYVTIYGNDYDTQDGSCERDYVSINDTCRAYELGIQHLCNKNNTAKVREIINISTGTTTSVLQLVNLVPNVKYEFGRRRAGDPASVYGCPEKAYRLLGWKPKECIQQIVKSLIESK